MKNLLILLFCAGLNCLFFLPANAQTGFELTVEKSVEMGLEHNYRLRVTEADTEVAQSVYRQTRANRLPVISSQASYMRLSDNIPTVDFSFPGSDTTYTILPVELNQFHSEISVEQPLFTGGRLNRQIEAAEHRAEAAGMMERQEQADVAFEIRQVYWNLYRALSAYEALEASYAQVDEHLGNIRAGIKEGTVLRTDLLNTETRRSEILLEQIEIHSQVRVARLQLNRLVGLPADTETIPVTPEEPEDVSIGMDELVEYALEQRPDLLALSEQAEAHESEIRSIQGEWLPEIHLVGRYVYARPNQYFFSEQDQFRGTWEAGVRLRWNIWSGGQRMAETSQARARLQKADAQLADKRDQVSVQVAREYLELERASKAIEVAASGVESAEESFEMSLRQFEEGTILSAQVLDAETAYRSAEARYAEAVADYEIARASVINILGQIWGENDEL